MTLPLHIMASIHSLRGSVPVTAKLSRRFYERLGDEIANELVDWLNAVDATYRTDLRELNELNFARFMATVDQRFAEADAKLERRLAELEAKFERRLAETDARVERGFAESNQRFADVERQVSDLTRQGSDLTRQVTDLTRQVTDLTRQVADLRAEMLKWMFLYWTGSVAVTTGVVFAALRLR